MSDIVVSYVVTVYNKEPYIGYTIASLLSQEGDFPSEYIFVDDVSTDRSCEVIAECTRGIDDVAIIKNSVNAGPSVRLNQGARLARGRYLQFIDSDDILAANATALMVRLMEKHGADVVHGGWERTDTESARLIGRRVPDDAPYQVSDAPMAFVLAHRTRRMSQLVRREVFLQAGGCDERVFVQDESITLRLARVAKRFILLNAPVLLIPKVEGVLSDNIAQLNHDRFLAARNMILDFPDLDERARRVLYRRCISSFWKDQRHHAKWRAVFLPAFRRYLGAQVGLPEVDAGELKKMSDYFLQAKGVRRAA